MNSPRTLPKIRVRINNHEYTAFIDTGAAGNVMRADLIPGEHPQAAHHTFKLACGNETIQARGKIKTKLDIQGSSVETEFLLIRNLNEELILGAPFLEEEGAHLDYEKKCMYFGKKARKNGVLGARSKGASEARRNARKTQPAPGARRSA